MPVPLCPYQVYHNRSLVCPPLPQTELTRVKSEMLSNATTLEKFKTDNVRLTQHVTESQQKTIKVTSSRAVTQCS